MRDECEECGSEEIIEVSKHGKVIEIIKHKNGCKVIKDILKYGYEFK